MKLLPYHPRLIEMLQTYPSPGRGHAWLYRIALHIRHYHTAEATFALLRECADNWGTRTVPDTEIWKAIRKAYSSTAEEHADVTSFTWADANEEAINRILSQTAPAFAIAPVRVTAQDALNAIFQPDDLVCAGYSQAEGQTATLQEILSHADRLQFVVPNRMTARTGVNQQGGESFRCLANTGPREHIVIENDAATKEEQARILSHLATILPLILVVDSGGKSLHGWFACAGLTETKQRLFMDYAAYLGADPHTWTRCQWVRMPGGTRYGAAGLETRRQEILHFKPTRTT
jgi:hypothetical protein